jgi:predicted nucleotidyltransferase
MASPSKEDQVRKLILEHSPLKEWRFTDIIKEAKVTKAVANKWLQKYIKEGMIKRIKEPGRFPYFTVGKNNPVYTSLKRIYALEQLHNSGLLPKLATLPAKTIILFGSMSKGDWYKDSDIDLFILGNIPSFQKDFYEKRLNKHIELHIFEEDELKEVRTGLIKNVLDGYVIKGHIQDVVV